MFYAGVGFVTYKVGKQVAKSKARKALLGEDEGKA